MTAAVRALVRRRAGARCEYYQLRQEDSPLAALHVEHIRPRRHGGTDHDENLRLACVDCNLHKGPNLTGIDPETGVVTGLFCPRRQRWEDPFVWEGVFLVGRTAVGRTTVRVLDMNSEAQLELRSIRPPSSLKVGRSGDEVEPQAKAFSSVAVAFTQQARDLESPDGVCNHDLPGRRQAYCHQASPSGNGFIR